MPSSHGNGEAAPIQDLAFDSSLHRSTTPRTTQRQRFHSESHSSVESTSSSASAKRRFFPTNLFGSGGKKNHSPRGNSTPMAAAAGLNGGPNNKAGGDVVVVRSIKVWDVRMPPMKKHMVKNHLVPSVRGAAGRLFIQKHRRVTIEVHGLPVVSLDSNQSTISTMTPMKFSKMQAFLRGASPAPNEDAPLQDKDVVLIRILKLGDDRDDSHAFDGSDNLFGDDNDVASVSTLGQYAPDDHDEHFVPHYTYQLEDVEIVKAHGRTCEMKFGSGQDTIIRDIKFEAEKDALLFEQCLADVKRRVQERARRMAQEYRELLRSRTSQSETPPTSPARLIGAKENGTPRSSPSQNITPTGDALEVLEEGDVEIRLLVDIVSAIDLPTTDYLSTDPYVTVKLGTKQVHRTKVLHKTRNPIWTVDTQSLFLLELSSEEFFSSTNGLTFTVNDYDALGRNDVLGRLVVPHDELLAGTGERNVYQIVPEKAPKKKTKQRNSRLVLRFKEASQDDVEFMRALNKQSGKIGICTDETFLAPGPPDSKLMKRMTKHSVHEEVHRVKPFFDPDDPERTKWLSTKDLETEALKDSKVWVEAGSGKLGKLYVEIIQCDGLPNMDQNLNPRDKTDAFVCLVYEDVVVNTNVIADTMKPRWMPWCCRAFAFNIAHPQSNLFLGVLDHDSTTSHDPIGRVSINLGRFHPDTLYDIKLPLHLTDEDIIYRKNRGTISLRLRLEWSDARKAFIEAAKAPPPMYVSCDKRSNWKTIHFTTGGDTESSFSINMLSKYAEELQDYQKLTPYAVDAALSVLLWRGSYPMKICGKSISLPIHSMTAFAWGLLVSWDFNFFPGFCLFVIGWSLLSMNQHMRRNPSPWHQPFGYWQVSSYLLFGRKMGMSIEPNQDKEAFEIYMAEVAAKKEKFEEERKLMESYDEEFREEFSVEIATSQTRDISNQTNQGQLTNRLRPLRLVLYPLQLLLEKIVRSLRVVVSVLKWDEPFFAWWITTTCFVASFVVIWIPWGFLLRWTIRVTVFVFLGPWMAIYDRCFLQRRKKQTAEEHAEEIRNRVKQRYLQVKESATTNRTKMERAMKLKSMRKYLYGKYLVNVPRFGVNGHPSVPLPESIARPLKDEKHGEIEIMKRLYGQHLTGDMIPTREFQIACLADKRARAKTTESTRFPRLAKLWARNADKQEEREPLLGDSVISEGSNNYQTMARTANLVSSDVQVQVDCRCR